MAETSCRKWYFFKYVRGRVARQPCAVLVKSGKLFFRENSFICQCDIKCSGRVAFGENEAVTWANKAQNCTQPAKARQVSTQMPDFGFCVHREQPLGAPSNIAIQIRHGLSGVWSLMSGRSVFLPTMNSCCQIVPTICWRDLGRSSDLTMGNCPPGRAYSSSNIEPRHFFVENRFAASLHRLVAVVPWLARMPDLPLKVGETASASIVGSF